MVDKLFETRHLQLRQVSLEDSNSLFEWRNHEDIRRYSNNPNTINYEEHMKWMNAVLNNPNMILLIGEDVNGNSIGVVRFDLNKDIAEISIYIVPGHCGAGMGTLLLGVAVNWVKSNQVRINKIFANIMNENHRSLKLFQKIGFSIYSKRLVLQINN